MARGGVNQTLIELLEQVLVNLSQVIHGQAVCQMKEGGKGGGLNLIHQYPAEEIVLPDVLDPELTESLPVDDVGDVLELGQLLLERGIANQTRELAQVGVADEQVIVAHVRPIHPTEQVAPLLAPNFDLGEVCHLF